MTKDEIMKIAREAGFVWGMLAVVDKFRLERFAELVAEKERISRKAAQIENEALKDVLAGAAMKERRAVWAEREACAAIAEDQDAVAYSHGGKLYDDGRATITAIANTIRARGQRDV